MLYNKRYIMDKTSWTTEQLSALTFYENHKVIYDGYNYIWFHKLEPNKWELHSIKEFENLIDAYSWIHYCIAKWTKELYERKKEASFKYLANMKSELYITEQAYNIAKDTQLKTKQKVSLILDLLPETKSSDIAKMIGVSKRVINKHISVLVNN